MFGVFFYVSLYIQNILGYSPIQAGAAFLPMTLLIILVAPIAGRLSDRVGSRWLIAGGMVADRGSLLIFSRLGRARAFWDLLPGDAPRRRRHGAGDDADDRGRDGLRAGRTRRASARPC